MGNKIDVKGLLKKVGKIVRKSGSYIAVFLLIVFIYERCVAPILIAKGIPATTHLALMRAV